jgi:hypothetical protein
MTPMLVSYRGGHIIGEAGFVQLPVVYDLMIRGSPRLSDYRLGQHGVRVDGTYGRHESELTVLIGDH